MWGDLPGVFLLCDFGCCSLLIVVLHKTSKIFRARFELIPKLKSIVS